MRWATRKDWARAILVRLIPLYMRFAYFTSRVVIQPPPAVQELFSRKAPFIWCFWHGRMLLPPKLLPQGHRVHVLISGHRDGRLIAEAIRRLRLHSVAGSSSRGARGATLTLMRLLRAGDSIGITPDGPRGPRMRAQKGAVALAALSGAPIVPVSISTTRANFSRSWDRFLIPRPFGRAEVRIGEPIWVPKDAGDRVLALARRRLEDELNRLTAEADRACGHVPIEPEALAPDALDDEGVPDQDPADVATQASRA
jgi:lysophospholipid acyltransferase (LPLAT)-like uncharacterized protein